MTYALQQTQARVNQVRGDLPPGLDIQIERLSPSLFPIISYNLEGGAPTTMYDIARFQIRPVLARVPGVGRVDVQASDVREIEVVADPVRLAEQGLSYDDIANAIRTSTSVNAVGRVAQDYKQYLVVTAQEATTVEDIANVVVGRGLRVRDVASVEVGTEDHVRIVAGDGRPAALLNITRQVNGNTVAIADSVEKRRRGDSEDAAARRHAEARLRPGVARARGDELGARRDVDRCRARRDHPVRLPAARRASRRSARRRSRSRWRSPCSSCGSWGRRSTS